MSINSMSSFFWAFHIAYALLEKWTLDDSKTMSIANESNVLNRIQESQLISFKQCVSVLSCETYDTSTSC